MGRYKKKNPIDLTTFNQPVTLQYNLKLGVLMNTEYGYFWNKKYKHTMRDLPREQRKAIHDELIKNGLSLDGHSEKHDAIIWSPLSRT